MARNSLPSPLESALANAPTFGLPESFKQESKPQQAFEPGNVPFQPYFSAASTKYGVPVNVLMALAQQARARRIAGQCHQGFRSGDAVGGEAACLLETAHRIAQGVVVCAGAGPIWAPRISGGKNCNAPRWIATRETASLQSLVHTRWVCASTPKSMRAPPEAQLSISTAGCAARTRSSNA